jgi:hypothetical protein
MAVARDRAETKNMLSAIATTIVLLVMLIAYAWPHGERRLARLFVATFGALLGSLVGRVLVSPGTIGHIAFVVGGAVLFAAMDWARRSARSTKTRV